MISWDDTATHEARRKRARHFSRADESDDHSLDVAAVYDRRTKNDRSAFLSDYAPSPNFFSLV